MTALLSSMEVKEKVAHGGGLSPVAAGELHTPAVPYQSEEWEQGQQYTHQ